MTHKFQFTDSQMEIGPFPILNQEEISHFYRLFEDMEDLSDKRRRRKEDEKGGAGFTDILTSLLMLEEEEKLEHSQFATESQLDFTQFEEEHKHKQLDEEVDRNRNKRARRMAVATENENSGQQQRRLWVKERSTDWWDRCNHPDFPEEEFKHAFRMSKATFDLICRDLDSALIKKNTTLRDAIPVRQRVAVCIWRLATGEPLRLVSKRFGLGISTCHKLVLEVCLAIRSVLMPKFLQWPDHNRLKAIKEEFKSISGIPDVGGSMYTTHVPIIAPKINVAAYFNKRHTERNQKSSYSMTVQGVVDPRGVFTDVCIGWPGSMADEEVLEKSALFERASRGLLKDVRIVGTCGFPQTEWTLVPYPRANLWAHHAFNDRIGLVEGVAKDTFARLKGRWSCLQKRTEVKLQDLPVVLGACCVLHNICEIRNEVMEPELKVDIFDDQMVSASSTSVTSLQARDHIAHNLLHHATSF